MQRRTFLKAGAAAGFAGAWAAAAAEEAMDAAKYPPFPIVDTHVHFWDPAHLHYKWIQGSEVLNRPYLPEHYFEMAEPVEVEKLVFVQAEPLPGQAVTEAQWVSGLAEEHPRIQGIVASAPLELGAQVLPTLEFLAQDPLVKGIRRLLQQEKDVEYALRPEFIEGVKLLAKVGFSFDFGIRTENLPAATKLARQCPDVNFIVDHLAFPNIREQQLDPWRAYLKDFAELPNTWCKMSGVATAADREHWTVEDIRPAVEYALETFGFERTAFGSDYPVMRLATELPRWAAALYEIVSDASEAEQRALFRETAIDFYRL